MNIISLGLHGLQMAEKKVGRTHPTASEGPGSQWAEASPCRDTMILCVPISPPYLHYDGSLTLATPYKTVPKSHFYTPSHNVQMTWLAGRLLVYKINAEITHYIKDRRTPCHWNKKLLALRSWFLTDYNRWLVTVTVVEYTTIFPDVVVRLCMHLR